MEWISFHTCPYNKTIASLLLPTIINNSKSIKPWYLISSGDCYFIFTNNSKIIWDKDKMTLTNYFVTRMSTRINNKIIYITKNLSWKSYPSSTKFKIFVSSNEFLPINKKLKFQKRDSVVFKNVKYDVENHQWISKEYKVGDLYNENILLSVWDMWIDNLKFKKQKINVTTVNEWFNLKTNARESCELDKILSNTTEDNFEVIDNFSNK